MGQLVPGRGKIARLQRVGGLQTLAGQLSNAVWSACADSPPTMWIAAPGDVCPEDAHPIRAINQTPTKGVLRLESRDQHAAGFPRDRRRQEMTAIATHTSVRKLIAMTVRIS